MKTQKETTFVSDYEVVLNAIQSKNVKNIFNLTDYWFSSKSSVDYSTAALYVFQLVAKNCTGFVTDICNRVIASIDNCRPIQLSDKQRWCVAFAAKNLNASHIEALKAENEAFCASVEAGL